MSERHELNICTDCLMMLANGDVGDRGDIGELTEYQQDADDAHLYNLPGDDQWNNANTRHAARMNAHWPGEDGWELVPGDCEGSCEFSWSSCDGCGSSLGGDRHHAVAWKREVTPPAAPAYMLADDDAFGTFCPHDGTLATRTYDGVTRTDPHCAWNGHREDIVAMLDRMAGVTA